MGKADDRLVALLNIQMCRVENIALLNSPVCPLWKTFGMTYWRSIWSAMCKDRNQSSSHSESDIFIWFCVPNRKKYVDLGNKGCNQEWPTYHHCQWHTRNLCVSCPWNSRLYRVPKGPIKPQVKAPAWAVWTPVPRDQQITRAIITLALVIVDFGRQEEIELPLHVWIQVFHLSASWFFFLAQS